MHIFSDMYTNPIGCRSGTSNFVNNPLGNIRSFSIVVVSIVDSIRSNDISDFLELIREKFEDQESVQIVEKQLYLICMGSSQKFESFL